MASDRKALYILGMTAIAGLSGIAWWPRLPAVAEPSPLLKALGVAAPGLTGPSCHREPPLDGTAWRTGIAFLKGEGSTTCLLPPQLPPRPAGTDPVDYARITVDRRGRVRSGSRTRAGLTEAAAVDVADSVLEQARLRGARTIICGGPGTSVGSMLQPGAPLHGWETADYTALVYVHRASPSRERGYSFHLEVSRTSFVACAGPRKRVVSFTATR